MEQSKRQSPEVKPDQGKTEELSAKDLDKIAGGSSDYPIDILSFSFGATNAADLTPKKG
jgi:hypothetical protein